MKLPQPLTIYDLRFAIGNKSGRAVSPLTAGAHGVTRPTAANRQSSIANRKFTSGMALVISLIMLSVTLVMAVAFLALSRRERSAVTTTTDTATARLAADAALAAAQAQVIANIWSTNTGAGNFNLLVSTNYQNSYGFVPGFQNPTNVNYDYRFNGNPLTSADLIENVGNLWFLPRVPVFVYNRNTGSNDFRFFLDLNRNGRFETNGYVAEFDSAGLTNGTYGFHVGDPEWIGVLERPDQPHGPDNKFVARYAFFAQPIGNSLDLNYIHNQVFNRSLGVQDGYVRNQGVGSWELNLAAFLTDLNTNQWDPPLVNFYQYNWPLTGFANAGYAFNDAMSMVYWRYAGNYNNLASANNYFANAANVFPYDNVDNYGDGPFQLTTATVDETIPANRDNPASPWAGADNPNRFFSLPSDLFDATKSSANFVNRLWSAGTSNATYDRYTFYRMMDQLGTESSADDGRMNLNYRNVTNGAVVVGMETNQYQWTAIEFFTNAADRLLRYHTAQWRAENFTDFTNTFGATTTAAFGLDRIPVYVQGRMVYTPAVNRLLQLAANLYDASTNSYYPSVFRPEFIVTNTGGYQDIYIVGYHEIPPLLNSGLGAIGTKPLDAPLDVTAAGSLMQRATPSDPNANLYGVPWIIGAKKDFPSFNQLYMRNLVQVTRKLEVTRTDAKVPGALATNQMFEISITNRIGYSFWNSYNTNRPGNWTVYFRDIVSMTLSNGANQWQSFGGNPPLVQLAFGTNFTTAWPGSAWTNSGFARPEVQTADSRSFVSGYWDFGFLPVAHWRELSKDFEPIASATTMEKGLGYVPPLPDLQLATTNRVQAVILDGNHVVDYVQLRGPNGSRSVQDEVRDTGSNHAGYWNTNFWGGSGSVSPQSPTWGVYNQIMTGKNPPGGSGWKTPPDMPAYVNTPALAGQYFAAFFTGGPVTYLKGVPQFNTNLALQVPYTPTRSSWDLTLWQANDPLVHYISSDLASASPYGGVHRADDLTSSAFSLSNPKLYSVTDRYQPWGRYNEMSQVTGVDTTGAYNLRLHDPLVWGSDYWDFPNGKYPTVGWIGRVHRGTPWQTVYLKQRSVLDETDTANVNVGYKTWASWTGNTATTVNNHLFDSPHTAPLEDRALFDLFTTRLNNNAARGALSVNQTHLAAWSALLSGLVALTNVTDVPLSSWSPVVTNLIISPAGPAGNASAIGQIVNGTNYGINTIRSTYTNADGVVGTFERVGDILSVPAFTEKSPFINLLEANAGTDDRRKYDISDEMYEWLPQQTLGLLRANSAPRYVVYCYGQALRPAPDSRVTDAGANFGLCTNYQVVAERAARAVVRIERQVVTDTNSAPVGTKYTTTVESYNVLPPD